MNELQRGFLEGVRNVSYNITDFLDNRRYLALVDEPEIITDNFIFNLVIDMTMSELDQMGIILDIADERYSDVYTINTILYLRTIFDMRKIERRFIKNLELTDQIYNLVTTNEFPKGFIHTLIDFTIANTITGTEMDHIKYDNSKYSSDQLFIDFIKRIIEKVFDRPDEVNADELIVFTKALSSHHTVVESNVLYLINHPEIIKLGKEIVAETIMNVLTKSYRKTSNVFPPALFNLYLCDNDPHPFFKEGNELNVIVAIRADMKQFFDYYGKHKIDEFTYAELLMIACEYYRPNWPLEKNEQFIKSEMESNNIDMSIYSTIIGFQGLIAQRGNL